MSVETIFIYTFVALFYVISPGPAILLAVFNGMRGNMGVVVASSLGNITGLAIVSTASILGLGVILQTSSLIFSIVKFAGALYLIYLGIKFILGSNKFDVNENDQNTVPQKSMFKFFSEAFLIAVTNPKAVLFFTAIFPQFLDVSLALMPQFMIMTVIFLILSFSSLFTYGFIAKKLKIWLNNPRAMKWFGRVTGGIFIGLGAALTQLKNA